MMNKKNWIIIVIALGVILLVGVIRGIKEPIMEKEIRIVTISGVNNFFPFFIAQEERFFDKYDLNVKFEELPPSPALAALLAGDVDYMPYPSIAARASLKGGELKVVKFFFPTFGLVGKPGLKIENINKIGITVWNSASHYAALKVIAENDLDAEIVVANTPAPAALLALLHTGRVDALFVDSFDMFQLEEEGYSVLVEIFDDWNLLAGLVTTDEKLKNNPEEVEKVIKAIREAKEFIITNPQKTKDLFFTYRGLEKNQINQRIVDKYYPLLIRSAAKTGLPFEKDINLIIKLAKVDNFEELENIEKQIVTFEDLAKVFDLRFLEE